MQRFWEVAPPGTWAMLGAAAVFLLIGFVLLSHTLVRRKAFGDDYSGILGTGVLESTIRLGAGCVLAGGLLWAIQLDAPSALVLPLAALTAAALTLETAARLK